MNQKTSSPEFDAWWISVCETDEFRGVSMAAALAAWNAKGDKAVIVQNDAPKLPEAFTKFYEYARNLGEMRGVSLAAAYMVWLAAEKHCREEQQVVAAALTNIGIPSVKRKRANFGIPPIVGPEELRENTSQEEDLT